MSEVAKYSFGFIFSILILAAYGCAVPVAPTGGEPDRSGPKLASTQPASGTVNFRERVIQFTFDDFVDRSSFARAFRIEPGIATPYEIKWRRKTASIHLLSPLPDNTTVVFTVGSELKDTRGNNLNSPLEIAVSTGPEINSGEAMIQILPLPGISLPDDMRVFLYKLPYELDEAAFYLGQADTSGTVTFKYLADGEYASFLVQDVNRNRIWDPQREYAQPTAQRVYVVEDGDLDMGVAYYAQPDTVSLRVTSVGLFSKRRLRVEFSKPVRYSPGSNVLLEAIDSELPISARMLFVDTNDPNVAYFHTETDLSDTLNYKLLSDSFQSDAANTLISDSPEFQGSSEPDTSVVRFHTHLTQQGVRNTEPLIIQYSGVLENTLVADSVQVLVNRETVDDFLIADTEMNILRLTPTVPWNSSDSYTIRVWDPDSQRHITLTTQILDNSDFGELSVTIADSTMFNIPMVLKISGENTDNIALESTFVGSETITDIPVGLYSVIVYPDPDGDNKWDPGTINPFRQPDPIFVNAAVPVRGRMTGEIVVDFD